MSTLKNLNVAYAQGCAMVAALAGSLAGSWVVFALTLALLLVGCLYKGEIRAPRKRPPGH